MIEEIPERLREALFIDAPHAGAMINSLYGIVAINKRWVDLFGWTESENEITSLLDLAERERDRKAISEKIMLMIETGVPYDRMELIVRTKLGGLRKILIMFLAVFDQSRGGRFDYAIVWVRDRGPYEVANENVARLLRLWAAIVIVTVLLYYADFADLAKWAILSVTGLD